MAILAAPALQNGQCSKWCAALVGEGAVFLVSKTAESCWPWVVMVWITTFFAPLVEHISCKKLLLFCADKACETLGASDANTTKNMAILLVKRNNFCVSMRLFYR